jgi:hypothetical protein
METIFTKSFSALHFAFAAIRIAFAVPLQSNNAFQNRIEEFSFRSKAQA